MRKPKILRASPPEIFPAAHAGNFFRRRSKPPQTKKSQKKIMTTLEKIEVAVTEAPAPKIKIAPAVILTALRIGHAVRQGDVLIQRRRRADLPAGLKIREDRALAVGTRGAHAVTEPADLLIDGARQWIVSPASFTVTHPEHGHILLPGGCYLAWGQVEFSNRRPRRVVD